MVEVTLPDIPEELGKENTVELYWEVAKFDNIVYRNTDYKLCLMNKHIVTVPEREESYFVENPKKRWWNLKPYTIRETKVIPSHQKEVISVLERSYISGNLNFSEKEVYVYAEHILWKLKKQNESSKLIGKYTSGDSE